SPIRTTQRRKLDETQPVAYHLDSGLFAESATFGAGLGAIRRAARGTRVGHGRSALAETFRRGANACTAVARHGRDRSRILGIGAPRRIFRARDGDCAARFVYRERHTSRE